MCRSLRVLVASSSPDRLSALRQAAAGAEWELSGGAVALEGLVVALESGEPDVVVIDAELGLEAVRTVRRARPGARLVAFGPLPGADAEAGSYEEIGAAILGLPRPGGPVGGVEG